MDVSGAGMGDVGQSDRAAWEGEMFRLLAENVLDYAIFVVAPDRHILTWSKGAERLLGFTEGEIVGRKCDLFFTPEDVERGVPQKELDDALATGRGDDDRWHVRKDGTRFWSSGMVTPLREPDGTVRGFAKIMRDRTALKRTQDAHDDALAYAEAIVATVREPLVVLDGGLRVRTANRSFYRTFGVRPADTEGRLLYDLGNGQWDIPALRTLLGDVLPKNEAFDDFEVEHDFPGVGRKVMLLNARKVYREGNHTELILLAIEDVTAVREAERAGREAEARFTEMVKNVRDHSIFLTDPAGVITSWNVAAERIIGYAADEAVGRPFSLIFTPEDVAAGVPDQELRQAREEGRAEDERWHRRKDGSVFWALGIVTPLHGPDGRLSGYSKILRDMTEWKRADEASRDRQRQLELVTDHAPVLLAHCDREFRFRFVNRPYAGRFGLHPRDLIGKTIPEVVGGEAFARIEPHAREALAGRRVEYEADVPYDGIGTRTMRVAYEPERDGGGRVVGYVAAIQDVSERKKADERLRTALTAARMVVWEWTPADGRLRVSENAADVFGLPAGAGLTGIDQGIALLHPDDVADYRATFQRAIDGRGSYLTRYRLVRPDDGRVVWIEERGHTVFDQPGGAVRLYGVAADVTARREAEEAAENSRRMLHALVERCPFGIYVVDADFRLASVNAGTAAGAFANVRPLHGRPFDEVMRAVWPEPLATDLIRTFRHTLATGEPYFSKDFVSPRADIDRTEAYEWELHRVTLPDGRPGVVCYYFDATRLRQVEQELKDADRRKDEFLATLAHELRNPLAPLRNGLQVMKLAAGDPGAVEKARGMMERQLAQMVHLIDDLLDVSRISRGKLLLRRGPVELAAVVQSAVEASRPVVEAAAHRLVVALPPDPVWLDADPTRMAQVLSNLLTNAAKYTERGGDIRLAAARDGGEVVVSVRDTGVGIAPEHLPRVFEMFSQVSSALDRSQGGLGIGLALVKGLVEMHGGSVEARSEGLGKGSEFVVRLPVAGGTTAPGASTPADELAAGRPGQRILVADDNRDAADSLAMLLRLGGHEVHAVHDGAAAVEAAGRVRPDVAVLDIGMPGLNGYDAARRIREQPWGRRVVLVALTGWGQDEDRRRAAAAGFDHHLTKPVDPAALDELLASVKVGPA